MNGTLIPGRFPLSAPEPPDGSVDAVRLCVIADLTYRQVDHWTRTGLLTPVGDANPGAGHPRAFPPDQIARAKAISALLRAGMALPAVRKHIDEILAVGGVTYGPVQITYTPESDPA